MLYCTIDDLRTAQPEIRLIEVTDDARPNETGSFATAIAQEMIVLSCGVIDGFLDGRYVLPIPVVPAIVRKIAVDLTLHSLYERVDMAGDGTPMATRRKSAMDLLKLISKGDLSLGLPKESAAEVQTTTVSMTVSGGLPEFTDRSMDSLGGSIFQQRYLE